MRMHPSFRIVRSLGACGDDPYSNVALPLAFPRLFVYRWDMYLINAPRPNRFPRPNHFPLPQQRCCSPLACGMTTSPPGLFRCRSCTSLFLRYTLPSDVFAWRSSPFLHHIPLRPFPGDTFDLHPNDAEPQLLVAKRVEFAWLLPLSAQTLLPALQAMMAAAPRMSLAPPSSDVRAPPLGTFRLLLIGSPSSLHDKSSQVGRLRSPQACLRLPQASRVDGSFAWVISIRVVSMHSTLIPPDGHGFNRQVQASLARSRIESKPDPHFPSALPRMLDHLALTTSARYSVWRPRVGEASVPQLLLYGNGCPLPAPVNTPLDTAQLIRASHPSSPRYRLACALEGPWCTESISSRFRQEGSRIAGDRLESLMQNRSIGL
ncbi:hypothetical protein B0H14DRAFT_3449038 [Mycena olivaceomarginata]|nr:hypothetical protein B0H14DRAFT_3449038 [Mycena olivaceomarginata]